MAETGEKYHVDSIKDQGNCYENWQPWTRLCQQPYIREEGTIMDSTNNIKMKHAKWWKYSNLPSDNDLSDPNMSF